jgi:hypothetical protein
MQMAVKSATRFIIKPSFVLKENTPKSGGPTTIGFA